MSLQIEIRIGGRSFKHFSSVEVSLSLDTVASTFNFVGFFDIEDRELRTVFQPLKFKSADIWAVDEDNGINEKLISGTILNTPLKTSRKKSTSAVSGYSITGVLEDSNIPTALYPLQFDGIGLDEIAKKITRYFGLQLFIFDNAKTEAAKPFELAKAKPTGSIKGFLGKIARQRGLTLAHDNLGRLLIYKVLGRIQPKIRINESDIGVLSVTLQCNGQSIHSDVTVINQSSIDNQQSGQSNVVSPWVESNIKRPLVKILEFGDNADAESAAKAILCAEAKNFPIIIELEGWTFNNELVRSGFYIEIEAPSIFIEATKMVLQNVTFKQDPKTGKTMILTAVLPCVYTGELPSSSPFKA